MRCKCTFRYQAIKSCTRIVSLKISACIDLISILTLCIFRLNYLIILVTTFIGSHSILIILCDLNLLIFWGEIYLFLFDINFSTLGIIYVLLLFLDDTILHLIIRRGIFVSERLLLSIISHSHKTSW